MRRLRVKLSNNFQSRKLWMSGMSGSPEAIQTLPPPARVPTGELSASPLAPGEHDGRPRAISKVAWVPQSELGQTEWLATGRRLGAIGRCSQWWIGDWIRYGTTRWGEKYAEAARVTGYDVASLRNMAWVASQFDLSLRSDKLTWSHHVLLAPLDTDQQVYWLDRALEERLSVADLRLELRANRGSESKAAGSSDSADSTDRVAAKVCPHCGHALPKSTD
jgi:hypothetical protein